MLDECRLCGHDKLRLHYTEGVRGEFKYYICRNCRLVSYDMSAGFDQEKHTVELLDPRDMTHKFNRAQRESYAFVRQHVPRRGSLLDIGCNNGAFLLQAKEDGWQVRGIELFPELAEHARSIAEVDVLVCDFLEYEVGEDEQYDIVVLKHVLEHLPDPVLAMRKLRALLRDGGYALLEFPNIGSPNLRIKHFMRRHGLARWKRADYVPHHANEFCRYSFKHLLARTGFRLERWSTYSSKRWLSPLYSLLGFGTKARALIQKHAPTT